MINLKIKQVFYLCILLGVVLFGNSTILAALADQTREVRLNTPFPRIEIQERQTISMKINIINKGSTEEVLDLTFSGPEGWQTAIKRENYVIKSIYLDKNESSYITFEVTPPLGEGTGNYTYIVEAISRDKTVEASLNIQLEIIDKVVSSGITLTTPYLSIESPSGVTNQFTLDIRNRGNEDRTIEFYALYSENWKVTFTPKYEDILIRSLDFKADESKGINVIISPPPDIAPGEYNVTFVAESGALRESLSFILNIFGTYELRLATPDELLSINAVQGKETPITIILENVGTSRLDNVHFSSTMPSGWDVAFEPYDIAVLDSGSSREIRVTLTVPSDAIIGDYIVTFTATAEPHETARTLSFRATVLGSLSWGLVGIGLMATTAIIVFVVFWRLGRR